MKFGLPVRKGDAVFQVPVQDASPMSLRLPFDAGSIGVDWSAQPAFERLRDTVLVELTKDRTLFRSPPTLESLQAIAPIWGFLRGDHGELDRLSPYMTVDVHDAARTHAAGVVDLQLRSIEISRTTIRPTFTAEAVNDGRIDIDWEGAPAQRGETAHGLFVGSAGMAADELEEVSDVPEAAEGTITLADPAVKAREKVAAKAHVRAAFEAAENARVEAEAAAAAFLDAYDLSDSESAFSEWLSSDEENE